MHIRLKQLVWRRYRQDPLLCLSLLIDTLFDDEYPLPSYVGDSAPYVGVAGEVPRTMSTEPLNRGVTFSLIIMMVLLAPISFAPQSRPPPGTEIPEVNFPSIQEVANMKI